jgi:hypothetical protein
MDLACVLVDEHKRVLIGERVQGQASPNPV